MTTDLLASSKHDISSLLPAKLLPAVLSASKSSNADTRSKSIELFSAIISHTSDDAIRTKIATEVLALPKTGKSASAEHRVALFGMTKVLPPSDAISVQVIDTLIPIVAKENNEAALVALAENFEPHLGQVITSEAPLAATAGASLAKELNSAKLTTRRALSNGVGRAIWTAHATGRAFSAEGRKLLAALAPAFETNLTTASGNAPSNPAGFLEGYVAVSLALGPLSDVEGAEKLSKSAILASLLVTSPKASFLLNDKAYGKLPGDTDREWLLRALEVVVLRLADQLKTKEVR